MFWSPGDFVHRMRLRPVFPLALGDELEPAETFHSCLCTASYMSQFPSIYTLPIFRNTQVAVEPGPGRIPVDHQVRGTRVKYWRELRASKTIKWETFPHFPLILNADGSPWAPACMWLLDRARAKPNKVSSLNPVAQGLRAYKKFLDEYELEWDDFSSVDKYLRPTYVYKTHLDTLRDSGEIKPSTARGRMQTVVSFYRFLSQNERMGFSAQNAPWVETTIGIEFRDTTGFKRVKEVTTVDVSIRVPKRDYAWDRRINDGGKLLPMSRHEQIVLVKALKKLGNREYELMHYVALLTGARIQTVLTLRWGAFSTPPSEVNQWPIKLQCGPGTGIDTKGDVADVYLSVQRDLYEWLHTYAISERARSRRTKSHLKHDPINYLFLSNRGGSYYESKDDRNALRESDKPLKRSSSTGQDLRSFMTDYVIPEICKTISEFHYRFHDLRATFGMNWVDAVMKDGDTRQRYLWARDQLRKLMWHKRPITTDGYIDYRQHLQQLEKAEADWNRDLLELIRSA